MVIIASDLTKVADLIDKEARWWDVAKTNSTFEPHLAREIMKILFVPTDQPDRQIWSLEKMGTSQ